MSETIESCDYYACNRGPGEQHHLDCGKFPASPEQLAEELGARSPRGDGMSQEHDVKRAVAALQEARHRDGYVGNSARSLWYGRQSDEGIAEIVLAADGLAWLGRLVETYRVGRGPREETG